MSENYNIYVVMNTNGPTLSFDKRAREEYEKELSKTVEGAKVIGEIRNPSDFLFDTVSNYTNGSESTPQLEKFFGDFDSNLIPVDQMQRRLDELVAYIENRPLSYI